MQNNQSIHLNQNQGWSNNNPASSQTDEILASIGNNLELNTSDLKQRSLTKKSKRQFTGFILMASGAFLGFISCLLTVTNPIPELYNIILYGLTTCAITIIMWGLYFVFE